MNKFESVINSCNALRESRNKKNIKTEQFFYNKEDDLGPDGEIDYNKIEKSYITRIKQLSKDIENIGFEIEDIDEDSASLRVTGSYDEMEKVQKELFIEVDNSGNEQYGFYKEMMWCMKVHMGYFSIYPCLRM